MTDCMGYWSDCGTREGGQDRCIAQDYEDGNAGNMGIDTLRGVLDGLTQKEAAAEGPNPRGYGGSVEENKRRVC
jgi:hypothetical protein